jgi:hypothetical protein
LCAYAINLSPSTDSSLLTAWGCSSESTSMTCFAIDACSAEANGISRVLCGTRSSHSRRGTLEKRSSHIVCQSSWLIAVVLGSQEQIFGSGQNVIKMQMHAINRLDHLPFGNCRLAVTNPLGPRKSRYSLSIRTFFRKVDALLKVSRVNLP